MYVSIWMPLLKSQNFADQAENQPQVSNNSEVFYVPETGQIFDDYEKYVDGLVQQSKSIWTCKYSGKSGLTFQEALESEMKAEGLLSNFPEVWKNPILRLVQHCTKAN